MFNVITTDTMRAGGRALAVLYLHLVVSISASEYGIPIEVKLWDKERTPIAHMVDVTNGFGLKVLAEHNFLNDNNIAFSPYGLMGILVALYEGVDGESSYQIQRGMALPWNRNVMRVGFRDIHRTLKTYFVPEEGFLAGLALNNENVTFNDGYKKILRFYGFDLDNDQLPTTTLAPGTDETSTNTMPSTPLSSVDSTSAMTESTPAREETSTPTREETTQNPNVETIPSSAPNSISSTTSTTSELESTTQTQGISATESTATETTTVATSEGTASALINLPTTAALTNEPTSNNEIDTTSTDSTTVSTVDTTVMTDPSITMSTDTTQMTEATTEETMSTDTTTGTSTPLEILDRKKKSLVDFIYVNPPYVDDYLVRSYDIPLNKDAPNFDDTNFLVNGLRNAQVSYMRYDTVLDYAYLPHLEASALRLPLDSDRYYLLVVLPTRPGTSEIGRLLSRMARESDLSDVYEALRPRRVRAVVPSFTVKGHVSLTTDLQKLGIRDVFEPRQRDFTPMTRQSGVYVRSIEQAVSVAIRKYQPDDPKKNRYVSSRHPVYFSATFPFLYFVMDSTINVSLMAGKMVDPLNSRIL